MFEKRINMKEKHTLPNEPKEHKITLLLGLRGIKSKDLDFRYNNKNERFFSFGHWLPIRVEDISYIQEHCNIVVSEISWYDDDCGWQCYYRIDS